MSGEVQRPSNRCVLADKVIMSFEPRFVPLCERLDHALRGTTGNFSAFTVLHARGCFNGQASNDDSSNLGLYNVIYAFHAACDPELLVSAEARAYFCPYPRDASKKYYDTQGSAVHIPPALAPTLENIAFDYYLSTGTKLIVTDAHRGPLQEAEIWVKNYYKLTNENIDAIHRLYGHSQTVNELIDILRTDTAENTDPDVVVADLEEEMAEQFAAGRPVSRHFVDDAFDVHPDDRYLYDFVEACLGSNFVVIKEPKTAAQGKHTKPHWHAQSWRSANARSNAYEASPTQSNGERYY